MEVKLKVALILIGAGIGLSIGLTLYSVINPATWSETVKLYLVLMIFGLMFPASLTISSRVREKRII